MQAKSIWLGVRRGVTMHCPNCGEGRLFSGYLKLRTPCEACATDNTIYPSDDFPPYLTILVAGHVVIPLFMFVDFHYAPSVWLQAAIWLPFTTILCLALLPVMKGATVGLCWANDLIRQDLDRGPQEPAIVPMSVPGSVLRPLVTRGR